MNNIIKYRVYVTDNYPLLSFVAIRRITDRSTQYRVHQCCPKCPGAGQARPGLAREGGGVGAWKAQITSYQEI